MPPQFHPVLADQEAVPAIERLDPRYRNRKHPVPNTKPASKPIATQGLQKKRRVAQVSVVSICRIDMTVENAIPGRFPPESETLPVSSLRKGEPVVGLVAIVQIRRENRLQARLGAERLLGIARGTGVTRNTSDNCTRGTGH